MPLTLSTSQYPDVRRAVNPMLDDVAIPDAVIASEVYAGRAARYIESRVPGAAAMTGDNAIKVQRATMYKTAANLAEMLPELKQSKLPDQEAIYDTYTRKERAALLNQIVEQEIAVLLATPATIEYPTFFTIATGTRY